MDSSAIPPERQLIEPARRAAQGLAAVFGARIGGLEGLPGYDLVRRIDHGGQGVVFEAVQHSTGRRVAIKVTRDDPVARSHDGARLEREVRILGQLNHPHIVTIHDSGRISGRDYFVMDYIDGIPLDRFVTQSQPSLSPLQKLSLFAKVCDAVHAAHLRGVIHRDLKPSNILVDAQGEPYVLDFGLAKVFAADLSTDAGRPTMTVPGQFIGSLAWSSPEQAEGRQDQVDLRTDVYSLGVILYHILTDRFPYDVAGSIRDVMDNIARTEPAAPSRACPAIDHDLETIVLKCLAKTPERRYQTAGELARDIRHYLADEPIEARRDSTAYVLRKILRRHRGAVVAAAGFVVLITVAAGVLAVMYRRATDARNESEAVTSFLADLLTSASPQHKGKDVLVKDVLDGASDTIGRRFADQPAVEARLRHTIANTYWHLGEYAAAQLHSARAVELCGRVSGSDHEDTLAAINMLAMIHRRQGHFEEAERQYRELLSACERVFGADDQRTLSAVNNLGVLYETAGRFDDAEPLLTRMLESARRVWGESHPNTITVMSNLAVLYEKQNRLDAAEPLQSRALELARKVLGLEHPQTLHCVNNLAMVYDRQGRAAEAEPLLVQTLEVRRRTLGPAHSETLKSMHNLARVRIALGSFAEAETLLVAALEGYRRQLGEQHPETIICEKALAELHAKQAP